MIDSREVAPGEIAGVMRPLLADQGATVLLVAGEDRPSANALYVHYLLGLRRTPWELRHISVALSRESPTIPSLAALSFPISRFEREMRDLLGITPMGHPDPRPLVRHGFWPESFHPLRCGESPPQFADDGHPFPFTPVEGAGVYEIPVGPVHAGVIEPGHFRFNVLGETVLKMRARLYFTHKGTERLCAGRHPGEAVALAERVSGDSTVAHASAFCQAVESLAGVDIPDGAVAWRVILLELERLYNHITDVGAIIADTGFQVGQAHCMRLRERILRLNKMLTGSRLMRGAVVPGGVVVHADATAGFAEIERVASDFEEVVRICVENTLVADRLDGTGWLDPTVAHDFGVVGYVARASGLSHDARRDLPMGAYRWFDFSPIVEDGGDVRARLQVRVREARQTIFVIDQVRARAASVRAPMEHASYPAFIPSFGIVEAWRGRLVHMVMADDHNRLHRVKIVDPSFFNWPALARALENNIVPDFPLCNKSFNQSYSGNDL
jgi:Ni,Fe-hydrogenase III large subunit/Ni,Fe-hydrogenase III component G